MGTKLAGKTVEVECKPAPGWRGGAAKQGRAA